KSQRQSQRTQTCSNLTPLKPTKSNQSVCKRIQTNTSYCKGNSTRKCCNHQCETKGHNNERATQSYNALSNLAPLHLSHLFKDGTEDVEGSTSHYQNNFASMNRYSISQSQCHEKHRSC